jgi:hypothetical protein
LGGGAHFGGGGHAFADRGHGYGGHGYGYRGYGGYGYGYGSALLGGLALGYALDPYNYDNAYYDDPGQCVGPQSVWDPATGEYVTQQVPYAC